MSLSFCSLVLLSVLCKCWFHSSVVGWSDFRVVQMGGVGCECLVRVRMVEIMWLRRASSSPGVVGDWWGLLLSSSSILLDRSRMDSFWKA